MSFSGMGASLSCGTLKDHLGSAERWLGATKNEMLFQLDVGNVQNLGPVVLVQTFVRKFRDASHRSLFSGPTWQMLSS